MTFLSRRTFLKNAPVAAVIASAPVTVAATEIRAEPAEDTDMRCMRLARELFNAMKAHYGEGCKMLRDETSGQLVFTPPPPPARIVEFSGPGWYELESRGPELPTIEMFVEVSNRFPASPEHGRWFSASPRNMGAEGPCYFRESWLRQIIVRKIGGVS